jgi:hypothetical protein
VITVDEEAEQLSISGSTSGTMEPDWYDRAAWLDGNTAGSTASVYLASGLDVDNGDFKDTSTYLSIYKDDGGEAMLFQVGVWEENDTITGNRSPISYAAIDETYKTVLKSYSDALTLSAGTGFDDVTFGPPAVPQPGATSLLALVGLALLGRRKGFGT